MNSRLHLCKEPVTSDHKSREMHQTIKVVKDEIAERDQSPPEKISLTNETSSTSNLSSPASAMKSGDAKDALEDTGGQLTTHSINHEDPILLSWESGSVSSNVASRVTLKILVSNNMAGSIIGRSGQTILELQSESSAKIRLSQSGDFFPGTSDRVCLIHGLLPNVKKGVALVLGKLYESQLELVEHDLGPGGHTGQSEGTNNVFKINFTIKILIPSAACGMLIGKEGATIQGLKDKAGCSAVRLSQKILDHSLPRTFERVLTVSSSDLKTCIHFTELILEGFVRHPEICRYLNGTTSYSRSSNVLSFPMSGSNPLLGAYSSGSSPMSNIAPQMYTHGHSMSEIEAGVQGLGFDVQPNAQAPHSASRPCYVNPPTMSSSILPAPNASFLSSTHMGQRSIPSPVSLGSTINLAVPDSMIGSILGKRGQTLMEIQSESGAQIRVSQKNEYVPGTSNRIVTLSGSQESITSARNMIRKLLSRNT